MKALLKIVNIIIALFFIILQQYVLIGIGLLVYDSGHLFYAILVWLLCIPMIYLNMATWKYIHQYGLIAFITVNADTSEIDVKPEDRVL